MQSGKLNPMQSREFMQDFLIVVAGGTGDRMGSAVPKQFLELAGKAVLIHTLDRFCSWNPELEVILVLHPGYISYWEELCEHKQFERKHRIVEGGRERFFSVKNGLDAIDAEYGIVGIHDAVRPLVSNATIERCYATARVKGSAIPVMEVVDSMRVVNGEDSHLVDRSRYRVVQTPQCFELNLLREAYAQPFRPSFTDSASVLEASGKSVHLVHGNRENIKLTTPSDMLVAGVLLEEGY